MHRLISIKKHEQLFTISLYLSISLKKHPHKLRIILHAKKGSTSYLMNAVGSYHESGFIR